MCDIPVLVERRHMFVHTALDVVFLFVDTRIEPVCNTVLHRYPCYLNNNFVIIPFSGVRVWNNPVVQLARQSRGPGNVVTLSSKELQLRIVGASFVELVEGITRQGREGIFMTTSCWWRRTARKLMGPFTDMTRRTCSYGTFPSTLAYLRTLRLYLSST